MLKRLTNKSEHRVFDQVARAADEFGAEVYRKIRVADVIDIEQCSSKSFRAYALMAHYDFVVCNDEHYPQFAIEFDGPGHDPKNDHKKNQISQEADLALFRVDLHASNQALEEMSLLRYLVHVWFMGRAFEQLQRDGQLPPDEPFIMWSFLKSDAKTIFDSEYNFLQKTQRDIYRLNRRFRFSEEPNPAWQISHISLTGQNGGFASFVCLPVGDAVVFGRYQLSLKVPCFGALIDIPFGAAAIADFADGRSHRDLVTNIEVFFAGGGHTLPTEHEITAEIGDLRAAGYRLVHGGGPDGGFFETTVKAS